MPDNNLFEDSFVRGENIFTRVRANIAAMLEPSSGETEVPGDSPVHFTTFKEEGVLRRLGEQVSFAVGELRRDPSGLIKAMVSPDVSDPDQMRTKQAAWALTVAVPALLGGAFIFGLAMYWFFVGLPQNEVLADASHTDSPLDFKVPLPDKPKAAERSGGGGGGGRQEVAPPMKGKLPTAKLDPPILAPTTHPTPRPPSLPMTPTIQADPTLIPRNDDPNSIGDPRGVTGPPSDGPGKGNGIGTGKGGGVGSGDGTGAGPGRGWNTGGGDPRIGGGSGSNSNAAVTKARVLNSPRPNYTEKARQNKTQGNVVVKALLGGNGQVKSAKVVRGLPDGLNEKAIEAVYRLNFVPARNSAGQPVDSWLTVSVNFTIR